MYPLVSVFSCFFLVLSSCRVSCRYSSFLFYRHSVFIIIIYELCLFLQEYFRFCNRHSVDIDRSHNTDYDKAKALDAQTMGQKEQGQENK